MIQRCKWREEDGLEAERKSAEDGSGVREGQEP